MMSRWVALVSVTLSALIAVIWFFPLSWAIPSVLPKEWRLKGVVQGSVWNGSMSYLMTSYGRIDKVALKASPLAWLRYRTPLAVDIDGMGIGFTGKLGPSQILAASMYTDLSRVDLTDPRLQGLIGLVSVDIDHLRWNAEQCVSAKGRMQTDMLARNQYRLQWRGPILSGPIMCKDGKLNILLMGQENSDQLRAELNISFKGHYSAKIMVTSDHPAVALAASLYGFTRVNDTYILEEKGQWAYSVEGG